MFHDENELKWNQISALLLPIEIPLETKPSKPGSLVRSEELWSLERIWTLRSICQGEENMKAGAKRLLQQPFYPFPFRKRQITISLGWNTQSFAKPHQFTNPDRNWVLSFSLVRLASEASYG